MTRVGVAWGVLDETDELLTMLRVVVVVTWLACDAEVVAGAGAGAGACTGTGAEPDTEEETDLTTDEVDEDDDDVLAGATTAAWVAVGEGAWWCVGEVTESGPE